jgi:predicted DNA-binding protein YlxM (UPF0122 family)
MSVRIPIQAAQGNDGRIARRDAIDLLRNRIGLLAGKDRLIMRMYFDDGASARRIAALLNVSASTIARRIQTLSKRLLTAGHRHYINNGHNFTHAELQIAKDHFIRGMSLRSIAAQHNCSVYRIRETIRKIKLITENVTNNQCDRSSHFPTKIKYHNKDQSNASDTCKGLPMPA